jgi:hypothetical protein
MSTLYMAMARDGKGAAEGSATTGSVTPTRHVDEQDAAYSAAAATPEQQSHGPFLLDQKQHEQQLHQQQQQQSTSSASELPLTEDMNGCSIL